MIKSRKNQVRTIFITLIIIISILEVNTQFHFLILNTFLGYIPVELAFLLKRKNIQNTIWFWPILITWLLFYPNAPYMLTDLFHLSLLIPNDTQGLLYWSLPIWTNFTLLLISTFSCTFIGFKNLFQITSILINKIKKKNIKIYLLIILMLTILASIGVFIGRFLRIHTIYLFISPRLFIYPLIKMWSKPDIYLFTVLFTIIQLFIYWIGYIISNNKTNITTR